MKKRITELLLIILFTGILAGCVSTSDFDYSAPLNLYGKKRGGDNTVYFIGEGRSDNQRQAELLSYVDLFNKVYRYLGIAQEPESYMELTTMGTISAYNLVVQEKNSYVSEGENIVALVASANEKLLAKDRSPDMEKEEKTAEQAIALVRLGDDCMMENRDVDGLRYYLQSMILSYGLQYIEDEFSFSSILEEVLSTIRSLSIEISKIDSKDITCRISVSRHDSIVPSKVKDSQIKASFKSKDSRGNIYDDSFTYTTDTKGRIDYAPMVHNLVNEGEISFNFDFEKELEEIEKLSIFSAVAIRAVLEEKKVSFRYSREINVPPVALCVQCVDYKEETDKSKWLANFMAEKYAESSVKAYYLEYVEDETIEDMLKRMKQQYPQCRDVVVLRVGVGKLFETRMNIFSIGVEGSTDVYNSVTGTLLYSSNVAYGNGFGETLEEAQSAAFRNFVLKMMTLLKAYYV